MPWSVKVAWATQSAVAGALPSVVVAAVAQRVGLLSHAEATADGGGDAGAAEAAPEIGGSGGLEKGSWRRSRIMYAPGRLVHLTETDERHGPGRAGLLTAAEARWVPREALAAGGVQSLSARLLLPEAVTDHFPWFTLKALDQAIVTARAREDVSG